MGWKTRTKEAMVLGTRTCAEGAAARCMSLDSALPVPLGSAPVISCPCANGFGGLPPPFSEQLSGSKTQSTWLQVIFGLATAEKQKKRKSSRSQR